MKFTPNLTLTILIFLVLSGGFFRFYNLNWDESHFFHPDERNIANAVGRIQFFSQLNPGFFAYGGFPIYLYRLAGDILVLITKNTAWISDWSYINIIGRNFSAFFSTLTIIPLFLLARRFFDWQTSITTALVYTFTVSSIQVAHFAITESFLVLTVITICLISVKIAGEENVKNYVLCGAVFGLALASKTSALLYLIIPFIATLYATIRHRNKLYVRVLNTIVMLITALAIFTLFSPYTFLSWNKFIESMRYESGVATGSLPVPYILQFTYTTPYLYQLKNLFWQMGPIALFSLLGFILLLRQSIKKYRLWVLLIFPIIYFAYIGSWHTKFTRYMLPILPFLIIFASYGLIFIKNRLGFLGKVIFGLFIMITILWTLAFCSIYIREQTRITASKWIFQNIPPGSRILVEHWDDGLPVEIASFSPSQYKYEGLTIYEPDNQQKIEYFAKNLSEGDYLIINSRRLYGTLMHLPDKYPITSKYYKLLFNGSLGYVKVAEFSSYPSIFGLTINDDLTEESFQVYDHPKVSVFKNERRFSEELYLSTMYD